MNIGCSTFLQGNWFWWDSVVELMGWLWIIRVWDCVWQSGLSTLLFWKTEDSPGLFFFLPGGERRGDAKLYIWECSTEACLHIFCFCVHIAWDGRSYSSFFFFFLLTYVQKCVLIHKSSWCWILWILQFSSVCGQKAGNLRLSHITWIWNLVDLLLKLLDWVMQVKKGQN